MAFKTDIKDFPFDRRDKGVWYFSIDWINKNSNDFHTVQGKKDLVVLLGKLIQDKDQKNHELFGVWLGEYLTDIFKIPIEIAFNQLSKYFTP